MYWSSVGTEGWLIWGSPDGLWYWSPLGLSWGRRLYWENPRLSSVSHGPPKEEEEVEGREEEWSG